MFKISFVSIFVGLVLYKSIYFSLGLSFLVLFQQLTISFDPWLFLTDQPCLKRMHCFPENVLFCTTNFQCPPLGCTSLGHRSPASQCTVSDDVAFQILLWKTYQFNVRGKKISSYLWGFYLLENECASQNLTLGSPLWSTFHVQDDCLACDCNMPCMQACVFV